MAPLGLNASLPYEERRGAGPGGKRGDVTKFTMGRDFELNKLNPPSSTVYRRPKEQRAGL